MPRPPMNDVASLILTGQSTLVTKYLFIAFFTAFVYDHLLTLGDEVATIWKGRQSIVTWIFYLNRYYFLVAIGVATVDVFYPVSPAAVCLKWGLLEPLGLTMPAILSAGVLMSLRVYAVWGKNKLILGLLITYIFVQAGVGLYTFLAPGRTSVPSLPIPLDAFRICAPLPTNADAKKTSLAFPFMQTAFDATVVVLTLIPTMRLSVRNGRLRTFARDGVLYFVVNLAITLTWAIMKVKAQKPYQNVFALPTTITFILMANRITMSLRAPPEEQGSSTAWNSKTAISPRKTDYWTPPAKARFDVQPEGSTELSDLSTSASSYAV